MKNLPLTLGFSLASAMLQLPVAVNFHDPLVFVRHRILDGEIWRLFTSHVVHFSTRHMLVDLLAFFIAAGLCESLLGSKGLLKLLALLLPGITLGLLFVAPGMTTYGGLSSLTCGLLACVCLQRDSPFACRLPIMQQCISLRVVTLAVLLLYIGWQGWQQPLYAPAPQPGGSLLYVAWQGHVLGVLLVLCHHLIPGPGKAGNPACTGTGIPSRSNAHAGDQDSGAVAGSRGRSTATYCRTSHRGVPLPAPGRH